MDRRITLDLKLGRGLRVIGMELLTTAAPLGIDPDDVHHSYVGRHPTRAAAIAATYLVAFRAAEGAHDIDIDWRPEPTPVALEAALQSEPATAAGAVFHASEAELEALVPELAARAGAHEDAHLAKYTLACFSAAANDDAERRLYLSAAAYLSAWWNATV
jgi:hypothetical protein